MKMMLMMSRILLMMMMEMTRIKILQLGFQLDDGDDGHDGNVDT